MKTGKLSKIVNILIYLTIIQFSFSLAVGVENAEVVCCFITPEYQASLECQFELQYAKKRCKKIIACILTDPNTWIPTDWLHKVIHDVSCVSFDDVSETPDSNNIIQRLMYYMTKPTLPTSNSRLSTDDKPSYLCELIKYKYQRNSRIERFMNPEKSFPIKDSYINLVIVNTKDQQEKENQMRDISHHTAILGTYEDIYAPKTSIDVKNILEPCKTPEKQVLVFGRAGIGKSTFCRFVAYQWATGAYFRQFKILVVIQLRNLTIDKYPQPQSGKTYSLIDIIKREVFKDDLPKEDEAQFEQQFDVKKILWILDGYDEFAQNVPSYLKRLLDKLLETPHYILTSRPYLNTLSYKVKMEITGFTDKNVEEYIYQFFHQLTDELIDASSKGQYLLQFLHLNPRVFGVAHIPVNLELICSIWSDDDFSSTQNLTVTTLYTKIIKWLCRRYLPRKNVDVSLNLLTDDEIYDECKQELEFLQCLAFEAMKENQIIIQAALLKKVLKQLNMSLKAHPHILNFGVLKASDKKGTSTCNELDKDHYFIHLSFQEYFAARYIINQLTTTSPNSAIKFIREQKYNQRYALMFTFIGGLCPKASIDDSFWSIILEEPKDLLGIRHMQLIIASLEATYEHGDSDTRTNLLQRIAKIIQHNILHPTTGYERYLLRSLRTNQSVTCHEIITNTLINLLKSEYPAVKKHTLYFITGTTISKPSNTLLTVIADCVSHTYVTIRHLALDAIRALGEKAATKEVIDKLVVDLTDENGWVRSSALDAIEALGEKAVTKEVIDQLAIALTDKDKSVRISACYAVGKIGEKAATKEVIDQLVIVLTDEDKSVRSSAWNAIEALGEKAATKEVIDTLVVDLTDEDARVRGSAWNAVRTLGEKAATKEVIDKLVVGLTDEDVRVRSYAWDGIKALGEKAATKEVIDKLVVGVRDENARVRSSAWDAIQKLHQKAATKEVIDKLVDGVTDEGEWVRISAWNAVKALGEKAVTKELTDKLLVGLRDENEWVRNSAWDAIGALGEKAITKEVIVKKMELTLNGDRIYRRYKWTKMEKIINSCLEKVDPEFLYACYMKEMNFDILGSVSIDQLLNIWFRDNNCHWLSMIVRLMLERAGAVVVRKKTVVVYETKEPIEIVIPSEGVREQLKKALIGKRADLFLSFD